MNRQFRVQLDPVCMIVCKDVCLRVPVSLAVQACEGHMHFTWPTAGLEKQCAAATGAKAAARWFAGCIPAQGLTTVSQFKLGFIEAYPGDKCGTMGFTAL